MKYFRNRKPVTVDFDHMKTLHEECIEQLELMKVALETAQLASDMMRDRLDDMVNGHWHAYMDIVHLICMHDTSMNAEIKKIGLDLRMEDDEAEHQYQVKRILLLSLIAGLIRHHQRIIYIYEVHGDTVKDYLSESSLIEREYIATFIEMIHTTL